VSAHLEEPSADTTLVGGWPEDASGDSAPSSDAVPSADRDAVRSAGADAGTSSPPPTRSAPGRKGRPSVPSWDDIVFGTKGSGPA
jgi:hypothetical protein